MLNFVKLVDCGISERSSRVEGVKIREKILQMKNILKEEDKIVIDFTGIEYISTGFAKELIATIYKEENDFFVNHIALKVGNNENIKNIIMIALQSVAE